MNRRELISGFAKAAALGLMPPALRAAQLPPIEPYGTDRLENTEPAKLTASIKTQLENAKLPKPLTFEPFPEENWAKSFLAIESDPFAPLGRMPLLAILFAGLNFGPVDEYSTPYSIVGTSSANDDLKDYADFFNTEFKKQQGCGFKLNQAAWNAETALHETIHYILFNLNKDGKPKRDGELSLGDYVFSVINKLDPPQGRDAAVVALNAALKKNSGDRKLADKLTVARVTYFQLHERMADAGSTLYTLSNYTDQKATIGYYETLADMRRAYFTDDRHPTTTTIRAALKDFSGNSRKGISLIDAAIWASQVVLHQPEFQKSTAEMARDFRDLQIVANRLDKNLNPVPWYSPDRGQRGEVYKSIISARNRACGGLDLTVK